MKYIPPYGSPDPDASYVQGDESAGILGSITPAAVFEHPQREILAVVEAAGIVPSAASLTQLHDAIAALIAAGLSTIDLSGYLTSTNFATVAQILANTAAKILTTDKVWGAGALTALTDASSIALDLSTGINFSVTLAGNRTLAFPTNPKVGQSGFISVTQDATGGRTLSYGTGYEFFDGLVPDLSTAPGAVNLLYYLVVSPSVVAVTYVRGLA